MGKFPNVLKKAEVAPVYKKNMNEKQNYLPVFQLSISSKFEAYSLNNLSLEFIKNYLPNRKQRCKIRNCFSIRRIITADGPQRSILGPLLFNVFVNDIFLFAKNSTFFIDADNKTSFLAKKHLIK